MPWGLSPLSLLPLLARCSNLERHLRPSHSAPAYWSIHHPRGSLRWKPVPTASSMSCDVMESSSPTTVRFPPSSISVLVVRARPGIWKAEGVGDKEGLGMVEAPPIYGAQNLIHPCLALMC